MSKIMTSTMWNTPSKRLKIAEEFMKFCDTHIPASEDCIVKIESPYSKMFVRCFPGLGIVDFRLADNSREVERYVSEKSIKSKDYKCKLLRSDFDKLKDFPEQKLLKAV